MKRDPEAMQARILHAASREFARHGLAGTRVDAIAARAKASKRMLYYYFTSKEQLFRTILRRKLVLRTEAPVSAHESVIEHFIAAQRVQVKDLDYVRLLQWEALEQGRRQPIGDEHRAAVYADIVEAVREDQARGNLPADLDPGHLALSLLAIALFPHAFPQLTQMFTGARPSAPDWLDARDGFLRALAAHLAS